MENVLPKVRYVFNRRKTADNYKDKNAKRKAQVLLELYYRRQRHWYNTGVQIFDGQWSDRSWVINHPLSTVYNARLSTILNKANKLINAAIEMKNFNIEVIETIFKSEPSELIEVQFDKLIESAELKKKSQSVIDGIISAKNALLKYSTIVKIDDITASSVQRFMTSMEEAGKSAGTISNYMLVLKNICNRLKKEEKLFTDPFEEVTLPKRNSDKIRYLTEEELEKIENLPLEDEKEIFARDFFIFQSLTGMSYADVHNLKQEDLVFEDGQWILRMGREKTNVTFIVVITPKAKAILDKYGGRMNHWSYRPIVERLHMIGARAIGKSITTHMARHSFGVMALRRGVELPYLRKMMGHTKIDTTMIYAEVLGKDVIAQFDKLKKEK